MGIVVIIALVIAAAWWVDIRVHPFRRCPKCNGKRRNPGSGSSHWGYCSRCGGRGEVRRWFAPGTSGRKGE